MTLEKTETLRVWSVVDAVRLGTWLRSGEGIGWLAECFNDWGGRGYDGSVPGDGTKITPSGDRTT